MKNLKKYLIAVVLLMLALVFVACDGGEPDVPVDTTVKIAAINVIPTIYEGDEKAPYVLVNEDIYFEAELLAEDEETEPTEVETWSIDDSSVAEMKINEEGGIICTGKKAGNATVTAKNPDGTITASYKFEVATSKNAQDVLVAANEEIQKAFPKYIAADTVLPVPANPNVTIKYKSSITNGITVSNGTYKYAYKDNIGDVNKQINFSLTYHGQVFEGNAYFYEVKDVNNNLFVTAEKVSEKINAIFGEMKKANDKDGNPTNLPLVEGGIVFPNGYTKEEVGMDIALVWASDQAKYISAIGDYNKPAADANVVLSATVGLKKKVELAADSLVLPDLNYYVLFTEKNETVSFKLLDGTMKDYFTTSGDKKLVKEGVEYFTFTPISKIAVNVVAAGTPMDDIIDYYFAQKLAPTDGLELTVKDLSKSCYNLKFSDTTKKYTGLSVEWALEDEDVTGVQILESKGQIMFKAKGEYILYATFYYNKRILDSYFGTADKEFVDGKDYYWFDNSTKSYTKLEAIPTADEVTAAETARDEAKTALDEAKTALDEAKTASDEAKTALDEATEETLESLQAAYDEAVAAYDEAVAAYDKAVAAYDKAVAAVNTLKAKQIISNYFELKQTETYLWKTTREITVTYK